MTFTDPFQHRPSQNNTSQPREDATTWEKHILVRVHGPRGPRPFIKPGHARLQSNAFFPPRPWTGRAGLGQAGSFCCYASWILHSSSVATFFGLNQKEKKKKKARKLCSASRLTYRCLDEAGGDVRVSCVLAKPQVRLGLDKMSTDGFHVWQAAQNPDE